MAPSDRTRCNGHKLKHRRLHLNIRKRFFTGRMAKHWNLLFRKVMESPFMDGEVVWAQSRTEFSS